MAFVDTRPRSSKPQKPWQRSAAAPRKLWHLQKGLAYIQACITVARQRRQLMKLDDRMLKDIGISRLDAINEAERSLFDLPHDLNSG